MSRSVAGEVAVRLVLSTCADLPAGSALARALVEEGLAACVNVLPLGRSIYRWEGRLEEVEEHILVIKTTAARYPELARRLEELHPYDVPEILAVDVAAGAPAYLAWLGANVRP